MATKHSPDLAHALREAVDDVLAHGHASPGVADDSSIGSGFGAGRRPTKELLGHTFVVEDPRACLVTTAARAPNPVFAIAQWVWTLSGSDAVDPIAHYNPRGRTFSPDGVRLPGSFGYRMRGWDRRDQVRAVIDELRSDRESRRAVVAVVEPHDTASRDRDNPCAIALQYLIRDGRLHAMTFMRSQSAAMVLPYDGFLFMALQCWLAATMGVEPGLYHHVSGSLHVYEDELAVAERLLASEPRSARIGDLPAPDRELAELQLWEVDLRDATGREDHKQIVEGARERFRPGTFWDQARLVLLFDAARRLNQLSTARTLRTQLPEGWQHALDPREALHEPALG